MSLAITNATIVTMNDSADVVTGDVWVEHGRIAAVGSVPAGARPETTIDAEGAWLLPGLIQTHVHLCQTLFRGLAEDRSLLPWLRERVWPLEAAHDRHTLAASARLAAAELLLGGTTSVLTMETVHETEAVLEALAPTGLRATVGKCLMNTGALVPSRLIQSGAAGLDEALDLRRRWDGAADGRLRVALAPRFALSCTHGLLEDTAAVARSERALVHTHAAEQREEVALVRAETGRDNLQYLADRGLSGPHLCVAHGVWLTEAEQGLAAERDVKILHCPGSNLKLGSGIAPVPELRARGVSVSLGADGAACNNALDMFQEMRLAALLQASRLCPGALAAYDVVSMATREGARALGLGDELGAITVGRRADLVVVGRRGVRQAPPHDPYSTIVFASSAADVRATIVDGRVVARNGRLAWADEADVWHEAERAARTLRDRAGV